MCVHELLRLRTNLFPGIIKRPEKYWECADCGKMFNLEEIKGD